MKLSLKKGFLLSGHIKAAGKKGDEYLWRLIATDNEMNEVHEEFTNLTFEEALARAKEMLGKRANATKAITQVHIFGNLVHSPVCYWQKFKETNKPGRHRMTVTP